MALEDRLRAYVEYVADGGNPYTPEHPLGDDDREVWVSWRTDNGTTCLEIHVDDEQYGRFINGERADPSWEGGVNGPDVAKWEAVRQL